MVVCNLSSVVYLLAPSVRMGLSVVKTERHRSRLKELTMIYGKYLQHRCVCVRPEDHLCTPAQFPVCVPSGQYEHLERTEHFIRNQILGFFCFCVTFVKI